MVESRHLWYFPIDGEAIPLYARIDKKYFEDLDGCRIELLSRKGELLQLRVWTSEDRPLPQFVSFHSESLTHPQIVRIWSVLLMAIMGGMDEIHERHSESYELRRSMNPILWQHISEFGSLSGHTRAVLQKNGVEYFWQLVEVYEKAVEIHKLSNVQNHAVIPLGIKGIGKKREVEIAKTLDVFKIPLGLTFTRVQKLRLPKSSDS